MEIYSLIQGAYFLDTDAYYVPSLNYYQGKYKCTPIYPYYTISAQRSDYHEPQTVKFFTMLPITRSFQNYLVEYNEVIELGLDLDNNLSRIEKIFLEKCEYNIKHINPKKLIKTE